MNSWGAQNLVGKTGKLATQERVVVWVQSQNAGKPGYATVTGEILR